MALQRGKESAFFGLVLGHSSGTIDKNLSVRVTKKSRTVADTNIKLSPVGLFEYFVRRTENWCRLTHPQFYEEIPLTMRRLCSTLQNSSARVQYTWKLTSISTI